MKRMSIIQVLIFFSFVSFRMLYLGNYLQSNRCLGAISKSLVSRGFPPLDGILDPAPGVEKEAEDGFALGTNMTDFKFFALLDTVLLVD